MIALNFIRFISEDEVEVEIVREGECFAFKFKGGMEDAKIVFQTTFEEELVVAATKFHAEAWASK